MSINVSTEMLSEAIQQKHKSGCFKNSVLPIVPGAVSTLVSLVGLVALNILQYHYFSIVFAIGTVSSTGTIYQGYRFRLLKSFKKNNDQLDASLILFKEEIESLNKQLSQMESSLEDFEKQNGALENMVNLQKIENDQLHERIATLTQEAKELRQINDNFDETVKLQMKRLESLTSSLKEIEEAVFTDHHSFGSKVAEFKEEIAAFKTFSGKIESSVGSLGEQFEKLEAFGKRIENIFTQIEKWKNPNAIEMHLNQLQQLNSRVMELTKAIARDEGRADVMKEHIEGLAGVETKFRTALDILKTELKELNYIIEQKRIIVDGIRKMVQEIKELPSGSQLPPKVLELIHLL